MHLCRDFCPLTRCSKNIQAGGINQIAAAILWTTLRSLTVAMGFKSIGFENLDIVSSELVKFILVNTGYDSISKLESQVTTLESCRKELASSVTGASVTATTASNKVDDMKKTLVALERKSKKSEYKA